MSEQQSSADSAQPVAWRWRSIFNDSSWCYGPVMPTAHDQYVTEPLYVRTEPQTAPSELASYLSRKAIMNDGRVHLDISIDELKLLRTTFPMPASSAVAQSQAESVLVPKAALDWLFGQERDADGKWFGECREATKAMEAKHPRRYWWRSKFRSMIPALTRPQRDPAACPSCGGTNSHTSGCAK